MGYIVYHSDRLSSRVIKNLNSEDLEIILDSYSEGKTEFYIGGEKHSFHELREIAIFETEHSSEKLEEIEKYLKRKSKSMFRFGTVWTKEDLSQVGNNITKDTIGNKEFGWRKGKNFINQSQELTDWFWGLIHPSIESVAKKRFDNKEYADSVEASFKELNEQIKSEYKKISDNELDGRKLMQQVFSVKNPIFELADISDLNGKNIQEGYMFLYSGAMTGIRNPKAHKNLEICQEDAIEKIFIASHLLKVFESRK